MRIAYVITRADEVGGAHIHVRDMASWMCSRGHEVLVLAGGHGPFTTLIESARIPFRTLNCLNRPISIWRDWKAVNELVQFLDEYRPDLVSLHSAKAGLLGRLACKRLNLPVIFTAHGWSFTAGVPQPARMLYRLLESWSAYMVDKIITVCEADRQLALSVKVGRKCLIVAINNGMPDITEDLIANPVNKLPKIVMVARFEKQKDHITLIKALKELKHFDWELELVGSGPLVDQVQFLVEKYNLEERVKFLGRRDDVPEILSAADIFVLASFWEGFPRSILEAMRAALPIIASAVAGVPEAVNDLETGFLVRPGDVVQTRERLRSLLLDPELRKRLGANGRIKYENQFTFECMANKTLNVYESVLAK